MSRYKVVLHTSDGTTQVYETAALPYAKRYADLYKSEVPYVEIIRVDPDGESMIETFGQQTYGIYKP